MEGSAPRTFNHLREHSIGLPQVLFQSITHMAPAAAVVYADTIARETPERADSARELADLFCAQAKRRADGLFHDLWANDDDAGYKAAVKLLDGKYEWIEDGVLDPSGEGSILPEK